MRYFQKLDPNSGFITSKGKLFKFPDLGNGLGALETDHPALINEFEMAMRRSVGGVSEITQADFETLKKNFESPPTQPRPNPISLEQLKPRSLAGQPAAVGDSQNRTLVNPRTAELKLPPEQLYARDFKPKSVSR